MRDKILATLLFLGAASGCNAQAPDVLDLKAYYAKGPTNAKVRYPTTEQLQMLASVMPSQCYRPAPPITDRTFWDDIGKTPWGQDYLEQAHDQLGKAPEVPITDEIYRRANKEGNRRIYKRRYYRTIERLESFMLAECIENRGRFLKQIGTYLDAIMDMKSWLHPNHDDRRNSVLEGRHMAIDLGSRRFGTDLALAESLLATKLPKATRGQMSAMLRHRIIDCYLEGCSGKQRPHQDWFRGTSNWNSVCSSGALFCAITACDDANERAAAVGCALNSMRSYLSGFAEDGYCSEGAGYWNYGFGHYLYLAQMLHDYTDGRIDLFRAHNPEQLKNVGTFPQRYEIQSGTAAPFADGSSSAKNHGGFAYFMAAKHYGAQKPNRLEDGRTFFVSDEATYQLIAWSDPATFTAAKESETAQELPLTTYFDDAGMVISRGKQEVPFSIAIKAGHNAENHNHSDVGSYSIVLGDDFVTGDIGAPSYLAGAFSHSNPARSSWGHPVPRIDNTLQANGRRRAGTITATKFTDDRDLIVMDLEGAYELPHVESLVRSMQNDRAGTGAITITDTLRASRAVTFGTAVMTLGGDTFEVVDERTVLIKSGDHQLRAVISSTAGSPKIVAERVPVEHLREGGPAYRIGIELAKPVREGSITVRFTPVL